MDSLTIDADEVKPWAAGVPVFFAWRHDDDGTERFERHVIRMCVLYLYSSGDQGIDLGGGQELGETQAVHFPRRRRYNLKTCFESSV